MSNIVKTKPRHLIENDEKLNRKIPISNRQMRQDLPSGSEKLSREAKNTGHLFSMALNKKKIIEKELIESRIYFIDSQGTFLIIIKYEFEKREKAQPTRPSPTYKDPE